jgi:hypothetical protein
MTTGDDAVVTGEVSEIIVTARARGRTETATVKKTKRGVIVMTTNGSVEMVIVVTVMTATGAERGKKLTRPPQMNA